MDQTGKRVHIKIRGSRNEKNSMDKLMEKAHSLGLKGYAGEEGTVEVIAEGNKQQLWKLVKHCTFLRTKFSEILFYFTDASLA